MNHLDYKNARILVLGDSGVGKSSFVHLLCHSNVLISPQCTIGCSIDVKIHNDHILEFWDIGGSRAHKSARTFLYQDFHGIILVFDATNKKSRINLNNWLAEVRNRDSHLSVPILTIATKKDKLPNGYFDEEVDTLVDTQDVYSLDYDKLNYFFKQILDRKMYKFGI